MALGCDRSDSHEDIFELACHLLEVSWSALHGVPHLKGTTYMNGEMRKWSVGRNESLTSKHEEISMVLQDTMYGSRLRY